MKKFFVAAAATLALALAGCGSTGGSSQPEESHKYVIGTDCPADFEQWQCDDFNQMRENMEKDQEEATKVAVPTRTPDPIDPDKAYEGSLDESQGITKLAIGAEMKDENDIGIALEQMDAAASEGVPCVESSKPCYVVLKMYVDTWDSVKAYDPSSDKRSIPVIEYKTTDGKTVTVEPSKQALKHTAYAEDNEGSGLGVVDAGTDGEWLFGYRLDNFKNVEGKSYVAYFKDDESGVRWVQEAIDND